MGSLDAERKLDLGATDESRASSSPACAEVTIQGKAPLFAADGESTVLGKYQLVAKLGHGLTTYAYLARARGQIVIVKRLRGAQSTRPDPRDQRDQDGIVADPSLDEARLVVRLLHPSIVRTLEVGLFEGSYFFAMEYVDGQPLERILSERSRRGERLPPTMCARIVADALAGLHYAHELADEDGSPLKIVHRDIRPHNIFVTYEGETKLKDFGIAKVLSGFPQNDPFAVRGKTAYMAPEEILGLPTDRRADLFSMGIVLWELITLRRLMTDTSFAGTLHKLLNVPILRVSRVLPDIDPALDNIVARALERDAERRYASAGHMRAALEEYIANAGSVRKEEIGVVLLATFASAREKARRRLHEAFAVQDVSVPAAADLRCIHSESVGTSDAFEPCALSSSVDLTTPKTRAQPWPGLHRPSAPLSQAAMPPVRPLPPPPADLLWSSSVRPLLQKPKRRRHFLVFFICAAVLVGALVVLRLRT